MDKFYTYKLDKALFDKWFKAKNKLVDFWDGDNSLLSPMPDGPNLRQSDDDACRPLLNVLNTIPGIHTVSSCEGHGKNPYFVLFNCSSTQALHFLVDVFSGCAQGKRDDGTEFAIGNWKFSFANTGSIFLRAFENVEFRLESESLGKEQDSRIRLEVAQWWGGRLIKMIDEYCSAWGAYLEEHDQNEKAFTEYLGEHSMNPEAK